MKSITVLLFSFFTLIGYAQNYTIALDAGHGGSDQGATSIGENEAEQMLEFTQLLAEEIKKYPDINVVQTRNQNSYITLDSRIEFLEAQGVDLLISFHRNQAENPLANGVEIYIPESHHPQESQDIAVQLMPAFTQFGFADRGVKVRDFALMKFIESPVLYVELGFIGNTKDDDILKTKKELLVKSIAKYLYMISSSR